MGQMLAPYILRTSYLSYGRQRAAYPIQSKHQAKQDGKDESLMRLWMKQSTTRTKAKTHEHPGQKESEGRDTYPFASKRNNHEEAAVPAALIRLPHRSALTCGTFVCGRFKFSCD